jgi:hypothetical protein
VLHVDTIVPSRELKIRVQDVQDDGSAESRKLEPIYIYRVICDGQKIRWYIASTPCTISPGIYQSKRKKEERKSALINYL